MNDTAAALRDSLNRVMRGKEDVVEMILVALFSGGHVLLEDVPGVGKTTLAKALAQSTRADFHRIQFTPDLLPTDIVGGMVYSPKSGDFAFRPGPVFCHILLGDEINRASPRTQSALLEAMNERQVSVEGVRHTLAEPFMVLATQNPVEYHGTYPLPEAQLDRFALRLEMGYPDEESELGILRDQQDRHPLDGLTPVATTDDILEVMATVRSVSVENSVLRYIAAMVRKTRSDPRLRLGASPRATLVLHRTSQALAFLRDRTYVIPDDVVALAVPALAHRLVLETKASYSGVSKPEIVREIVAGLSVPV